MKLSLDQLEELVKTKATTINIKRKPKKSVITHSDAFLQKNDTPKHDESFNDTLCGPECHSVDTFAA